MSQPAPARASARFTGVIDTLSAGYGIVNRHPWIILLPILLDLFLWLGPQPSAQQLASQDPAQQWAQTAGMRRSQRQGVVEFFGEFNLLAALAPSMVGVPSLVASLGIRNPLHSTPVESWDVAAAIFFGALLAGMLLGSLYYAVVAQEVRDGRLSLGGLLGQAARACLRVLLYLLLLFGLGLLFGLPISLLLWGAVQVSEALGSIVTLAVMVGLMWVGIYLSFVPDAIFLSQVGPLQAVKNSVAVVRLNFWSVIGILGLIALVLLGMGRVWQFAAESIAEPWGLGVGILGNAYIASGLVAASMCFYRERIEALRASRQPAAGSGQQAVDSGQ